MCLWIVGTILSLWGYNLPGGKKRSIFSLTSSKFCYLLYFPTTLLDCLSRKDFASLESVIILFFSCHLLTHFSFFI